MPFQNSAAQIAFSHSTGLSPVKNVERPLMRWLRSWTSVALAKLWSSLAGPVR